MERLLKWWNWLTASKPGLTVGFLLGAYGLISTAWDAVQILSPALWVGLGLLVICFNVWRTMDRIEHLERGRGPTALSTESPVVAETTIELRGPEQFVFAKWATISDEVLTHGRLSIELWVFNGNRVPVMLSHKSRGGVTYGNVIANTQIAAPREIPSCDAVLLKIHLLIAGEAGDRIAAGVKSGRLDPIDLRALHVEVSDGKQSGTLSLPEGITASRDGGWRISHIGYMQTKT